MNHTCDMMIKHRNRYKVGFIKTYHDTEKKENVHYCHYCGMTFLIDDETAFINKYIDLSRLGIRD